MPRIAKWSEKSQCVKYNFDDKVFTFHLNTLEDLCDQFEHYIDKSIEDALIKSGWQPVDDFSQFVSVKEVPHG